MHPHEHAVSSAARFGGVAADYLAIHDWFDATKAHVPDVRHRAMRHHSEGIFLAEQVFGLIRQAAEKLDARPATIRNSDGAEVPIRRVAEQHVIEDLGWIPTMQDWLGGLMLRAWMMSRGDRPDRVWAEPPLRAAGRAFID